MAEAIFETALGPFIAKALTWSRSFEQVALFQSNVFPDRYSKLNFLMAVGARDEFSAVAGTACQGLEEFRTKNPNQWMPGFLSYDLKNEIEALQSRHENLLDFPDAYFCAKNSDSIDRTEHYHPSGSSPSNFPGDYKHPRR